MNRLLLFLVSFFFINAVNGQVLERQTENNNQRVNDTTSRFGNRSTSNKNLKNPDATIDLYKIISHQRDTIHIDTTLTIDKDYKFNYLREDNFGLIPFSNLGQTYNSLTHDFKDDHLMPKFVARARHFNYMEVEDVNYYYVPTPFTELMYRTAFEQGQLLDAFFTVNLSPQFNFSLAYKGLRSLGKYQHILTSTGNLRFTANYTTKNKRYNARVHIYAQDLLNQENGGIKDEDIINFESGNPEFLDRSVFDPAFEDVETKLEGKRFYLEHTYDLVRQKDSVKDYTLGVGNVLWHSDKFFDFNQTSQNDFFGEAFVTSFGERTNLESFYAEGNVYFKNKVLGHLKGKIGYNNFNYGYDKLVQVDGSTITNRLKGNVISVGGAYRNKIGAFNIDSQFGINVSGDFTGNFFNGRVNYSFKDFADVIAEVSLNSRAPNYNYLLYQSGYVGYNWQTSFDNVQTKQLRFAINLKRIANVELDYTTVNNYTFFGKNTEGQVRPNQHKQTINYVRVKINNEFKYRKFALNNTLLYQNVVDGDGVLNTPDFVVRNTLYYANHFFKKALFLQTGVTFNYFTKYNMDAYDPLLAEFYVQNDTELGGFPRLDFFINAKVRQTRIFFKAEHFNSAWTGYNFYAAPNYPYRDFTVRFGLVWNFFL